MGTSRNQTAALLDVATQLKDAGAVTASGAGTVNSVPRVLNLGEGRVRGAMVIDSAAIDLVQADETYEIRLQVSSSPTFASDVSVAAIAQVKATGRAVVQFDNDPGDGDPRPYARVFHQVGGTTPSLNYTAFLTKDTLHG